MLTRRQLVLSGIGLLLSGCQSGRSGVGSLRSLKQSIPGSLIRQFRNSLDLEINLDLVETRLELFGLLKAGVQPFKRTWNPATWFQSAPPQALLSLLGADWLQRAIDLNLILPIDRFQLPHFQQIPEPWQRAVSRDDQTVWGLPWRWGTTAIAYNRRFIQDPLTDWSDLWRPDLTQKLTLPDHPREVIGLVLKHQGRSYNDRIDERDLTLLQDLGSLHDQVLTYTSDSYQEMLRIEQSWVAVGWTEDLFRLAKNYPDFEVVIPASGSALWYDLWVLPRPLNADTNPLEDPALNQVIQAWFNLVMDQKAVERVINLSQVASVIQPTQMSDLSPFLQTRADFQSDAFALGEILTPLSNAQVETYLKIWNQMRWGLL